MAAEKYIKVSVRASDYLAIRKMADAVPGGTSITKMIAILVAGAGSPLPSLVGVKSAPLARPVTAPVGRPTSSRPRAVDLNVVDLWASIYEPPKTITMTPIDAAAVIAEHLATLHPSVHAEFIAQSPEVQLNEALSQEVDFDD